MEYRKTHLLYAIEEMRRQLSDMAENKCLTDSEVVRLSQRLDRLLNEYHELLTNERRLAS